MAYLVNDDLYPYAAVCCIQVRWGNDWYVGSGVLVGRNDVLTASHVIYDVALGGLADEIIVMPSFDANFYRQNGVSDDRTYVSQFEQYYTNFDPDGDGYMAPGDGTAGGLGQSELDVALLTLSEAAGDIYGWMGIDTNFGGGTVNITGHPSALQNRASNTVGNTNPDPVEWVLPISSFGVSGGNSGGPVWYDRGGGPFVAGVVSTTGYATDLGAHTWLLDAITANDHYISSSGSQNVVGSATALDFHFVSGARGQYGLTGNLAGATLTHLNGGRDGVDQLSFVDRIVFADGTLALDLQGHAGQAYRLYQAAFDRNPDLVGLGYWIEELDAGKGDLAWMANNFIISNEFRDTYGTPSSVSNTEFLDLLYGNVLDRAPDAAGFAYWMAELERGFSRERVLASFSESVENQGNVAAEIANGIFYV